MEELFRHIFTTMEPTNTNLVMPAWLDITAILFGAAFGSLSAKEHQLDFLGSIALGLMCGLGGGLIRDIILQRGGVYMITSPIAIPLCLLATLAVFFFSGFIQKLGPILPWIDIISVVLFAASGTEKALLYSLSIFASVMLGTMSGVGGGMLRDMVLGEVPSIFRRGNFYALCAVVSSFAYYVLVYLGLIKEAACIVASVLGVGLWWLSKHFNWLSPVAVDLSSIVAKPVKKIVKATPVIRTVANAVQTGLQDVNRGLEESIEPVEPPHQPLHAPAQQFRPRSTSPSDTSSFRLRPSSADRTGPVTPPPGTDKPDGDGPDESSKS